MDQPDSKRNPFSRLKSSLRDLKDRHEQRHRPTGFGFVFADHVDYLNPALWDAVAAHGSVFLSRAVLRVIEQSGPENVQPRYAMIFRGAQPLAVVAAQIVTVSGAQLQPKPLKAEAGRAARLLRRVLSPAAKSATARLRERMLVAGNLLSWGFHGVAFAPGENPAELWPAVAEALYRIRRAERLTGQTDVVMVKDLTVQQSGLESLRRYSYRPLETEPNMVLELNPEWRTYDDYLGALDAKYRRKVKDIAKKLTAGGCVVESLTGDLSAHGPRLHELYLAVQGKAAVRLVTLPAAYLPELARAAGENFRCTVIRRHGEVLGFVTSLRDGDTSIGYYIGFDRAAAEEGLPLYLRLLHATIEDALAWRCRRLSLGRTALEPKAGLGARPEPMTVWLRHRVPAINVVLRGLLGAVPHAEAPERSPFKARGPGDGAVV